MCQITDRGGKGLVTCRAVADLRSPDGLPKVHRGGLREEV